MPVGFGRKSVKSMGIPLSEMVRLKHSIIEVKAETDCLAHALIVAIVRITKHPNYNSYLWERGILPGVQNLLEIKVSIYNMAEVSKNSSDSKTTSQNTELSSTEA